MLKKCRQPELFRRKCASRYKKTDYGNYIFSPKEWVICLGQGIGEICILGYFFYHSWKMTVCINAEDLMGEPEIGRRLKASIWLQGRLNFEEADI